MSAERVYFKGTKYETRVDVGHCTGKCRLHGKLFSVMCIDKTAEVVSVRLTVIQSATGTYTC